MGTDGCGRATGVPAEWWRRFGVRVAVCALATLPAAGCSTAPQAPVAAAPVRGPTVAFDTIDGPPESIFRKLVQDLSDEAAERQLAVVSRDAPAQYRVRGYLAALVEGKRSKTVIAWVWDVYDIDNNRALRIRGEEAASAAGHGTWAAADDQVLRRIAKSGMERLAAFLTAPPSEPSPSPAPDERGSHVATIGEAPSQAAADAAALAFAPARP